MQVYKHSGAVPALGAIKALIAGSLTAMTLGVVYAFVFYYIPYVYLNFLMAIAVGVGSGYVVGQAALHGKIRNISVVGGIALLATLAGIYAEWGATIYAMYPTSELPQLWAKAGLKPFLPQSILLLMVELFDKGSWGLSANTTVHGWPLVALWLVEVALIVSAAIGAATRSIAERPFCERCQEWITGHSPHVYVGEGCEPVWTEVQNGTLETLALTPRATGDEPTYVRLTLQVCEGCSDSNYLTITACQKTIDSKGNPGLEERDLVTNLHVSATQVEIIQAANLIAPQAGELPLKRPTPSGNWTLEDATRATASWSQETTTGASEPLVAPSRRL
jgi:hypothetical protein